MPKKIISLDELSRFKDNLDVVLEDKANVDGNYPTMTVGSADSLTPYGETSGANDTTPFVFQSTGGSSDVGSKAYLKALRGNSVAFGQLIRVSTISQTLNGLTITNNNDGSITISGTATDDTTISVGGLILPQNHKYLLKGCPTGGTSSSYYYIDANYPNTRDTGNGVIYTYAYSWTTGTQIKVLNGTNMGTGKVFKPQLFDLTLMFGAGNEPTSVLEFNRLFPKPYYEYNAGTLLSCKVNGIKNVGYNAFDGELEVGSINLTNGQNTTVSGVVRSKKYVKVIAGQTYTFERQVATNSYVIYYDENHNFISSSSKLSNTSDNLITPNNCQYIRFIITSSNEDINMHVAFHLTWDSARTGYEPYESKTYALPNVELRSVGNAYDELRPNGTLMRRIGVLDLGTLTYSHEERNGHHRFITTISDLKLAVDGYTPIPILSTLYKSISYNESFVNKIVAYNSATNTRTILFINDDYTNATDFKNAMSGVYIYYELETPTEEQTENTYQEIQDIDDFGTQEFLYDSDIAIPVPQGNEFFYPVDYKAFIDSLGGREDIEYNANEIVSKTELNNKFVSLTQAEYDALTPDNNTFYFIKEE